MGKVGNRRKNRPQSGPWQQFWDGKVQTLLPGAIAASVALGLGQLGIGVSLEQAGYNALLKAQHHLLPQAWDDRIVVIAIDEASLKQYGRFPWSRDRYAHLLQALAPGQPAVVGFAILFTEPSPDDALLADQMDSSGNVVLAIAADQQGKSLEPVPALAEVSRQGHVYHVACSDGISRQSWLSINQVPSFAIALLQGYQNSMQQTLSAHASVPLPASTLPPLASLTAAKSVDQSVWLNWLNPAAAFPTYSFGDVVQGKVNPAVFTNKVVLVGITAAGFDPLQTPFEQSPPTSSVYFHAAALDNLLHQRFLQPLPLVPVGLLLLLLGGLTSWLLFNLGFQKRLGAIAALTLLYLTAALVSLRVAHQWLAIAAPIGTILLTFVGVQLQEQREKQLLMQLFAQQVAPETAHMLWQRKNEIFQQGELQPQELVATVLFMDIRGFSGISEKLPPSELLPWVNRYLERMTECIMQHGGVVDKYIGDAIMAVFGVPFPHHTSAEIQQDAQNAIAASLAMHHRLQQLNQELAAEGKPMIDCGIGIHTGLVVAGSVGGGRRLNYSVLGDTVNVAARLEAMNKELQEDNPYHVLITCETLSCVGNHYHAKPLGNLHLRGRQQPMLVYSILGQKTTAKLPPPGLSAKLTYQVFSWKNSRRRSR